jgi:hypothetical protein
MAKARYRMNPPTEPKGMHDRLTVLEQNHKNVLSRIDNVENSVAHLSEKIDQVLSFVQEARVRQLPPLNTIIITTVATFTLVSMIIGALWFIIDARVGVGVQRANAFTSQLADGPNNIYVQMHDHDSRIRLLERKQEKSP